MPDIMDRTEKCPGDEALKAFAADPLREDCAAIAQHIFMCDRCCDALRGIVLGDSPVEMTSSEKDFIERFTAERCRPVQTIAERAKAFAERRRLAFVRRPVEYALAAASADSVSKEGRELGEPCEEVRFVYASVDTVDSASFWRAELVIPSNAEPETMLKVRVTEAGRHVVSNGTLRLSGCTLPLEAGCATLPFALFLDGIRDTDVSLSRPGAEPIAGRLLFF